MAKSTPLHMIKLCVGVDDMAELVAWSKECIRQRGVQDHVTRMFPTRKAEILSGGSLYWVIRGMISCRQEIADLEQITDREGISRCRIIFKPRIIPVRPVPRRAFQGWRYFEAADAPPDLKKGQATSDMDEAMRRELAALGLL